MGSDCQADERALFVGLELKVRPLICHGHRSFHAMTLTSFRSFPFLA